MNGKQAILVLVAAVMALSVAGLMVFVRRQSPPPAPPARGGDAAHQPPPPPTPATGGGPRLDRKVLKRAKSATVFIQVKNASYLDGEIAEESSGTGFFISPDGQVATSWHVISAMKSVAGIAVPLRPCSVQVILRSGKRDQKVLPARLLAVDAAADLAILKVEAREHPWLPLGSTRPLVETAPLWVLGFPLGRMFSVLQRGPELSVNGGTVSSLRHDDLGKLKSIQFDAVVIKGNSGGPVITPRGEVVGIANIALGTSRVNFAIPVEFLKKLREECPPARNTGPDCKLKITSRPPGAEVFVDSRPLGRTPLETRTAGGHRHLVVRAPGHRSWGKRLGIYDGRSLDVRLEPIRKIKLDARNLALAQASGGTALLRGKETFSQSFTDIKAADAWKQDTGGSDERTWYVEKGALHQYSEDGMLHAVFAERDPISNFSFRAKVRIKENEKDGRAGLIFRSTGDGFALFRLHRQSGKVQLAYHVNQPFGWRILDERALSFKVQGGKWYDMEVQALDDQVVCLLDGRVVLEATVQQRAAGKLGFYSVDSQATFDDARVCGVSAGNRKPGKAVILRGFWFSDNFEKDCGYWQAFRKCKPAPPWPTVPSGCLHLDEKAGDAANVLTCYDIHDLVVNCVVSSASGRAGVIFRKQGQRHYLFRVEPGSGDARLFLVDGGKQKEIAAAADPGEVKKVLNQLARSLAMRREGSPAAAALLGNVFSMFVTARGNHIRAGVNGKLVIDVKDRSLGSGRVGLYADRAKAIFHSLDVASPAPAP
jgi:S1-C subfamily serine protease